MPLGAQIIRFAGDTTVAWRAFRRSDTAPWVAICDSLRLTSQGDTWEELMQTCAEMVQVLLRDIYEEGDLARFLSERGWRPLVEIPAHSTDAVSFDIPMNVAIQRNGPSGFSQPAVQ